MMKRSKSVSAIAEEDGSQDDGDGKQQRTSRQGKDRRLSGSRVAKQGGPRQATAHGQNLHSQHSSSTALSVMSEGSGSLQAVPVQGAAEPAAPADMDTDCAVPCCDVAAGASATPPGSSDGGSGAMFGLLSDVWVPPAECNSGCTSPTFCSEGLATMQGSLPVVQHHEHDFVGDLGGGDGSSPPCIASSSAAGAGAAAASSRPAAPAAPPAELLPVCYSSTDDNVQARLPNIRTHRQHTQPVQSPPVLPSRPPAAPPAPQRPQPAATAPQATCGVLPPSRPRAFFAEPSQPSWASQQLAGHGSGANSLQYTYRRARSSLAALDYVGQGDDSSTDSDTEEATRQITAAYRSTVTRHQGGALGGLIGMMDSAPSTPTGGIMHTKSLGVWQGGDEAGGEQLVRKRSGYHLTGGAAAVELFLRLNHARQTLEFVKRQTTAFAALDKAELGVWEALTLLDELREYEAVLMSSANAEEQQQQAAHHHGDSSSSAPSSSQQQPQVAAPGGAPQDMSLLEHALQTAELCRMHHPDKDWLHLVGLLHGLGKLLAHRRFGVQPQWAICGETFPVGCRFSPSICGSQYFSANPDRRRRMYNCPLGVYAPGCGLQNVYMSWGASEYLYLVLELNRTGLPPEAMFMVRHAKFTSLTRPQSCYLPLCSEDDRRLLPLLRQFQELSAWRRAEFPPSFARLEGDALTQYYSGLIHKYMGPGKLQW